MNLDELIIAQFCVIDELLPRVSGGLRQHGPEPTLPDSEVVSLYGVGELGSASPLLLFIDG